MGDRDEPKAFFDQVFEDQAGEPVAGEPGQPSSPDPATPMEPVDPPAPAEPVDVARPLEDAGPPAPKAVDPAAVEAVAAPGDPAPDPSATQAPTPDEQPVVALEAGDQALVDEAMKKTGLIWVTTPQVPAGRAFWHVWQDGMAYLLTGDGEQPDPAWLDGSNVSVVVRSKDNAHRLVTFDAVVSQVRPDADDWGAATTGLAAGRLNLHDAEHAPQRWARGDAVVYRLRVHAPLTERPGHYSDESHRAAPVPTPATTAGAKPWVLHRRGHRGRPLS